MSTNLRKAQKHMHRARELLNQEGQLGFGGPDGVETRAMKRKREEDTPFVNGFECPICLEHITDEHKCVMVCTNKHAICTECSSIMKQTNVDRCPMCRQYLVKYDFKGNCYEMAKFFDTLTQNEVLITMRGGRWEVFHLSGKKKGNFICNAQFPRLATYQVAAIKKGWEVPSQLLFPPYSGPTGELMREFTKAFKLRQENNFDMDLNMMLETPGKEKLYSERKLFCVLTPTEVKYDQDRIVEIIGKIKLQNWFRNFKKYVP